MPEKHSANDRLDSWKKIAAYLDRDVRTVMRWEQEKGLPVHRVPGGQRQAVFAYPEEIDAWLDGSTRDGGASTEPNRTEAEESKEGMAKPPVGPEAGSAAEADREPASLPVLRFRKWKLVLAAACLSGALLILSTVLARSRASAGLQPVTLKKLTDDGRAKGGLRTDGTTLYFNEIEGSRTMLVSAPISGKPIHQIETTFNNVVLQDLSSDGKKLLITSVEGVRPEGPLWFMPVQGGKAQPVSDAICKVARWSPDNRRIACGAMAKIMLMEGDGSGSPTVVSLPSPVDQVGWTPDGARLWLVLEDTASHTYSQWEMGVKPDGTVEQPQRVPLGPGCCRDWIWTPNKTFVYTRLDSDGKSHLMISPEKAPRTGAREAALPAQIDDIVAIASGTTDNTLYLATNNISPYELWIFNVGQQKWLSFLPRVSARYLAFAPDGQWITYQNTEDRCLWRSRVDGSDPVRLTKPGMEVEVSSWSPDGRRIAFMGKKPGKRFRIFLIGRDGGTEEEASEGNDNQGGPSWSLDGKELVYGNVSCEETQNCWIWRLNLESRTTEIVSGSRGFRTARWSPDGKHVAALKWQTHELMLFDLSTQTWETLADSVTGDNINWSSDSQSVFVDSRRDKKSAVEQVQIKNKQRGTVVRFASLLTVPGEIGGWIGLTPEGYPILNHLLMAGEIYELKWTEH